MPGPERRAARSAPACGFTLIELLVVLVIVGVLLAALTLAAGGSAARALENAARRSGALIVLACERAVIGGRDLGFAPTSDGMRFGYFERDGWRPVSDAGADELRARPWGDGVSVRAERDGEPLEVGEAVEVEPAFACLSSGELTPLRLEFARSDVGERWEVVGRLDGTVAVARVEEGR